MQGILEVLVTDFQGKPAQVGGVRLVSAERSGSPSILEQPLQQSPEKAGIWSLDFLSHTTELGLYKCVPSEQSTPTMRHLQPVSSYSCH